MQPQAQPAPQTAYSPFMPPRITPQPMYGIGTTTAAPGESKVSALQVVFALASLAGGAAGAYHGYKRTGSWGSAIGWSLGGSILPVIVVPVMLAQGFAKPKGSLRENPVVKSELADIAKTLASEVRSELQSSDIHVERVKTKSLASQAIVIVTLGNADASEVKRLLARIKPQDTLAVKYKITDYAALGEIQLVVWSA